MNRFLFFLILFFSASIPCTAQQFDVCMSVVSSSGGQGIQSNRYIAWTIGEPFIQTLQGGGYALTQGFHQPDPCGMDFVGTTDLADWGISVFPNPSEGWLTFRFSPEKNGNLRASAFDLLGRPLLHQQILTSPDGSQIDASAWPPGVYLLLIQDPVSRASATFRIVRI